MKVLVTAKDRQVARDIAAMRFPRSPGGRADWWTTPDGDEVLVGIFGQEMSRTFDRILVCQQKHMPEAYGLYLMFRLNVGGRFDRAD